MYNRLGGFRFDKVELLTGLDTRRGCWINPLQSSVFPMNLGFGGVRYRSISSSSDKGRVDGPAALQDRHWGDMPSHPMLEDSSTKPACPRKSSYRLVDVELALNGRAERAGFSSTTTRQGDPEHSPQPLVAPIYRTRMLRYLLSMAPDRRLWFLVVVVGELCSI